MTDAPHQHTNRLIGSTSPYLLQHAHNPVDWHPWGEEALALSRTQDRPIFLSIGYSACHWCHVMERESFENEAIAEFLRDHFVAIKVDREERPDLDEIYMTATQLMTHSGGWPMTVFLTPDLKPFYAGTYFPPEDKWGRPGFLTLLRQIARAWQGQRQELEQQADRVVEAISSITGGTEGMGAVKADLIEHALKQIAQGFDSKWGGFGSAPKFPPSMRLELLLRQLGDPEDAHRRKMLDLTLTMMARGGMYDQVGGGFARYSVDERWLVPHFEKMLYDNGLLARVYVLAFERTGNWYYRRVAQEILDYILREMTDVEGGFYSATDADSEGEEGKFFVWSPGEVSQVLGHEDAARFCAIYDITKGGNFEGHSIPNLLAKGIDEWAAEAGVAPEAFDAGLAPLRRRLWEHREGRIHPLRDDKVLASWNGLMIRAFAEGYRVFSEERYRQAAEKASDFILDRMRAHEEGGQPRLLRSYRAGKAALNAYQEDYSYLALALLDLHNATGEERWKNEGVALLDQMEALFWDHETGGFYFTSHDHESLITRTRSLQDSATPSGSSVAVQALIRAARLTGDDRYRRRASQVLSSAASQMAQMSAAFPNMLIAADEYLEAWPEGVRVPGADLVEFAGEVEPREVAAGGSFWVRARLTIAEGCHVGSAGVKQAQFSPTELQIEVPKGFTAGEGDIPVGTAMPASGEEKPQWVYSGEVRLGQEILIAEDVKPGRYPLIATLRVQPCDDQQCYPALEARLPLEVEVTVSAA